LSLAPAIHELLGSPPSISIGVYDGSAVLVDEPRAEIIVRRPTALVRLLTRPGELGLVRAYVCGDVDVTGDVYHVLEVGLAAGPSSISVASVARLVRAAGPGLARHLWPLPGPPEEEARLGGRRHSRRRDAASIAHHYDVSNEFYELVLGPSMTYSCAVFSDPADTLERAQADKIDLICHKLQLRPGQRLLDVGCGWGELLIRAARACGVTGVGITISAAQAEMARRRVAAAGLADRIEIRLQDYREIADGPFHAISSIGMFEHVGRSGTSRYLDRLHDLLVPGGLMLHHAIARPVIQGDDVRPAKLAATVRRVQVALGSSKPSRIDSELMQRYVFPDGELHEVGGIVTMLHETGFEVRHLESLREHYALTLRRWVDNLDARWAEACAEVGERRARVWKLYMAACAVGFERHWTQVHQTLVVKPVGGEVSNLPLRPRFDRPAMVTEPAGFDPGLVSEHAS
jgi:cyclopropane-fatty-acyl-phospholipid synthase